MVLIAAAVFGGLATLCMIPVMRGMPNIPAMIRKIEAGEPPMTDAEHVTLVRGAARDQTCGVLSHICFTGLWLCFLISWHDPWYVAIVYMMGMTLSLLIVRMHLRRRRWWIERAQQVENAIVAEAKVDEEAERLLRGE